MTIIGIPLSTYKEELRKIPKGILPTRTIECFLERLSPFSEELERKARQYTTCTFDPAVHCHALPLEFYETCSFEELAKIWVAHFIQLPQQLEERFESDPRYRIIQKLCNSTWRWGYGSEHEWNNIVDAYNGIRNFSFEIPGFEVTLDHTTRYNEFGCGEYDRSTYIDGVFAFRVHYRNLHVMTIGFSLASRGRLLLSQIQLKKEKGNRFLYALPADRVSYVVALFKKYFPTLRHYIIDGTTAVEKYLRDYRSALERELHISERLTLDEDQERVEKNIANFRDHIARLEGEVGERIRRTYRFSPAQFKLSSHRPLRAHNLLFHRIVRT